MEPYYNTSFGTGFEGVLNYTNELVDGMLGVVFIASLFVIMMYVLSKSEWRMSASLVFTSFICMLLSWILSLMIAFNEYYLYAITIIFAGSVIYAVIDNQSG